MWTNKKNNVIIKITFGKGDILKVDVIIGYAFEIYDGKTLNDYKGNVMATAPYAFYTKESIDRLVELWSQNTMGILKNDLQNVEG